MILTIGALLIITTVGFLTCKYLRAFDSLLLTISLSFAVGISIIYLQMFIYTLLNIEWSTLNILLPLFGYCLLILLQLKPQFKFKSIRFKNLSSFKSSEKFLLLGILCLVLFVGFESIVRPVYAWDAWSSWLMKSKMFYVEQGVNRDQFLYLNSEYPPLISMGGTFVYIVQQGIDDRAVLLFFYMFYIFMGIAIFSLLCKSTNRFIALVFTFLFLSIQNIIRHGGRFEAGQADLALSYFMLCGYILYMEYVKKRQFTTLLLLEFILSVIVLVKNEGLPFALLLQILLLYPIFSIKSIKKIIGLVVTAIVPTGIWFFYKYANNLPQNYIFKDFHYNYFDIKDIAINMSKELLSIEHWNLLWITFSICLGIWLFSKAKGSKELNTVFLIIGVQLLTYFLIFMITPVEPPSMHVKNVFDRLLIHISPFALLIIGEIVWYYSIKKKYEK